MKSAVVLVSGGLDSATVLAIAKSEGWQCHALSIDYGQRHKSELLAAAQGIELRKPLETSPALRRAFDLIREHAAFWDRDRAFAPDLAALRGRVEAGDFSPFVGAIFAPD